MEGFTQLYIACLSSLIFSHMNLVFWSCKSIYCSLNMKMSFDVIEEAQDLEYKDRDLRSS